MLRRKRTQLIGWLFGYLMLVLLVWLVVTVARYLAMR
jgi:hypothetical protein